jgi:hypothetical protein
MFMKAAICVSKVDKCHDNLECVQEFHCQRLLAGTVFCFTN